MESSEFYATVQTMHEDARARGLFFQTLEDSNLVGRRLMLHGRECLSFASCSYVGLEQHPDLVSAVHEFVDRYGTQFSASRGYVSLRAHHELEHLLDQIFGGYSLLATSTTLAHQIALPVLATERDAIVMDHQIHHSVHMAATLARAAGTEVELVRHGRIERAVEVVEKLARTKRRVWFACDGVFSMFGDLAPLRLLERILAVAPNVWLYIDDAHGMSWAGLHGRGSFLSRMPPHERLVLATSLNKAFSAGGGCVVFPNEPLRERVRVSAGAVVFSGPLQPPMLGAAIASAKIHLSPEITTRQQQLAARIEHCNTLADELKLPLLVHNASPIFFFRCGLPRVAFAVAERLLARGLYVTASAYPSVPMKTAGIRLSLTTEHSLDEITAVCSALSEAIPWAMSREQYTVEELDRAFTGAVPNEALVGDRHRSTEVASDRFLSLSYAPTQARAATSELLPVSWHRGEELSVQVESSICGIDRASWDRCMGTLSCSSWEALSMAEMVFSDRKSRENNWKFRYVVVRDESGEVVAMTYFTVMLSKDDMLMRSEVSSTIETYRETDPYHSLKRIVRAHEILEGPGSDSQSPRRL